MTVSEKIRDARSKAGLTQQQLADKIGVRHNSISSWENGVNSISIENLQKIADALGVPVAEFLDEELTTMTTGENIRNARKNAQLTQKALGELCGIAEPTIRRYESDKLHPKIQTLQKIADALGVPITEFLNEELTSMTTGERIRKARLRADMTQEQLAALLGVDRATISKYESGIIDPPTSQMNRIADLLSMDSAAADCEASDRERLIGLLFEFVERVVKKGATPEEVKVLPETARLLAELMEEGWRK